MRSAHGIPLALAHPKPARPRSGRATNARLAACRHIALCRSGVSFSDKLLEGLEFADRVQHLTGRVRDGERFGMALRLGLERQAAGILALKVDE